MAKKTESCVVIHGKDLLSTTETIKDLSRLYKYATVPRTRAMLYSVAKFLCADSFVVVGMWDADHPTVTREPREPLHHWLASSGYEVRVVLADRGAMPCRAYYDPANGQRVFEITLIASKHTWVAPDVCALDGGYMLCTNAQTAYTQWQRLVLDALRVGAPERLVSNLSTMYAGAQAIYHEFIKNPSEWQLDHVVSALLTRHMDDIVDEEVKHVAD